jgi:hypothetical protein
VADLGDLVLVRMSRSITRRKFLMRAMRGGLVVGAALSGPLTFMTGRADAAVCSANGTVTTWGKTCNTGTPSCSGCSDGKCVSPLRKRCTYWKQGNVEDGQYCWCSTTGCAGSCRGYYTCCDCWSGGSGGCGTAGGGTSCACKEFHAVGCCTIPCAC